MHVASDRIFTFIVFIFVEHFWSTPCQKWTVDIYSNCALTLRHWRAVGNGYFRIAVAQSRDEDIILNRLKVGSASEGRSKSVENVFVEQHVTHLCLAWNSPFPACHSHLRGNGFSWKKTRLPMYGWAACPLSTLCNTRIQNSFIKACIGVLRFYQITQSVDKRVSMQFWEYEGYMKKTVALYTRRCNVRQNQTGK